MPVRKPAQEEVENDVQEEAPTSNITLSKTKQTVELLKEKIHALEEKVESLTEERNFLRERLEDALKLKAEIPEQSKYPTTSQLESSEDTTSSDDSSSDSSEPS
ncbi:hypothetical protein R3I93_008335 [Phoxinus phoxinus]|uniref:Uncharacterized protein n=1 Tax=Phoxinus phoxinus TaxID=58324 RepID=A0AAN9D4N5_9TELE